MGLRVTLKLATEAEAEKTAVALRLLGHEVVVDGCELVATTPKREWVTDNGQHVTEACHTFERIGIDYVVRCDHLENPFGYDTYPQWTIVLGADAAVLGQDAA